MSKTTIAVDLAHAVARRGFYATLLDTDDQGHIAVALALKPGPQMYNWLSTLATGTYVSPEERSANRSGLMYVPGNKFTALAEHTIKAAIDAGMISLSQMVALIRNNINTANKTGYNVFVDTRSGGVLQELFIAAADQLLIPSTMDTLSISRLNETLAIAKRHDQGHGQQISIVPAMYNGHIRDQRINLEQVQETFGGMVLDPIPFRTARKEAVAFGQTAFECRDCRKVAEAIEAIADIFMKEIA